MLEPKQRESQPNAFQRKFRWSKTMYRNTTVGSLPLGLSRRVLAQCFASLFVCLLALCGLALLSGSPLQAQNTSGGGITGTITDPKGAVVPHAQVTATNTDTGVAFTRETTSAGLYSIAPLPVGTYNVEVVAKGFQRLLQENVDVDNSSMRGVNLTLTVGGESTTITVTDAPPYINTTDSVLGGTIENELYSTLPLSMAGGPRDPTAFQYLMPGVQENPGNNTVQGTTAGSSGIYGGTGQTNLNANYIEGMPVSNIYAQGSGTAVANAVSVDAVNQFSVQTSGASVSFGGAGVTNYTINSGGNQFHGTAVDFIRNTDLDTWGYFAKVANSAGYGEKPGEHQNDYSFSVGGPIFKDKLFFFGSYEGYRYTKISNTPVPISIPSVLNRAGNFTDLYGSQFGQISDPTYQIQNSRPYFYGIDQYTNGIPSFNVIPPSQLSPISLQMQSALPLPTNLSNYQNFLAVLPLINHDYDVTLKIDYTLNSKNKFELLGTGGLVGYAGAPAYDSYNQLPIPYAAGTFTNSKTATGIFRYTYVASQAMINTLSYGYTRNWGEKFPLTQGTPFAASALGITNTPPGNATNIMPVVKFSGGSNTVPVNWGSDNSSGPLGINTYTVIDNLTWIKNRHNVTFGIQVQWLETNQPNAGYGGYSSAVTLNYNGEDTGAPGGGSSYAAFLLGAVSGSSVGTQVIQDVGGRYRPISPYIQDNWQISPKLSLNFGLRYDYLQPYHEVHDRITFLNSSAINPITGTPGVLMFAGAPNINDFNPAPPYPNGETAQQAQQIAYNEYASLSCFCHTPVHPYNNNFQPRLSFVYAYTPGLVFSGAFGMSLTHSGGVGGGSGATSATGNNGEYTSSTNSPGAEPTEPSFFLNPNFTALTSPPDTAINAGTGQGTQGLVVPPASYAPQIPCVAAGTCSPYSSIPPWNAPGTNINALSTTGNYNYQSYFSAPPIGPGTAVTGAPNNQQNNYNCSTSGAYCNTQGVNYADPYYGGRGPQFITYNFSIQKMLNKKAVFTAAYSGSQTHFLPGGAGRGYAENTFSPDYFQEYSGKLQSAYSAALGTVPPLPYPRYNGSGSSATVARALTPFPQYSSFSDIWPQTGNANYNSLQLSVTQRPWHNLSGFMNYTRAKEIDDTGTHRTQFPLGPQDGNFVQSMSANRVDRGLGSSNQTNGFNLGASYTLPFGRGQAFFATNHIMGLIAGGWNINGIYKYRDGTPLTITIGTSCMTNAAGAFPSGQGTCFPDYVPGFDKRRARINGRWGRGPGSNSSNYNDISYLNPDAFQCPDSSPADYAYTCTTNATDEPNTTFKIGNVARSAPYGLHGPGWWDIDLGIRRTFNILETASWHLTFQVEADVTNATNSTFFNIGSTSPTINGSSSSSVASSGAPGWASPSSFGTAASQNQQIQPRDWQLAGRFRF
jgi:hypothetical protein